PFIIMYVVSRFTKPVNKDVLDRFYVKMKTPAMGTKEQDAHEMKLSYANPQRFNHKKMFPATEWEFEKLDKQDVLGLLVSSLGIVVLIGILLFVASSLQK
ncbi:MAG: hypothetical protein ACQ9ET_04110, partial [Nitrosomonadaceae bacterium]